MRTKNLSAWTLATLLAVAGILAFSSSASAEWHWHSHNHATYYSGPYNGTYYTGPTWAPQSGYGVYSPGYGYSGPTYNSYSYYPGYTLSSGVTPDGIVIGSVGAPYYYGGRYYYSSPWRGNVLR